METNGNGRIELLKKRENEIRAKIAAERVKQQKRKEKDRARLAAIIGAAMLDEAARVPDFELLLKQRLSSSETLKQDERACEFLVSMGWL
jgi:hypothetical protein